MSGLPHVVIHAAVSLDGASTGFQPDVARFYELAATWDEDVTLAGADTILAQEAALSAAELPGPDPSGPLLAVVDSRARVSAWKGLRECGHWRDVIALRSESTPTGTAGPPGSFARGDRQVDLAAALERLAAEHEASVVRVDSGSALNGALLDAGVVGEVSLLIHPVLVGPHAKRWSGAATDLDGFGLTSCEALEQGLAWARYVAG